MAKKILQIDGGGLKGLIPAVILDNFEKKTGKPCWQTFDFITGTSTGAIIGGVLSSGVTNANTIRKMYVDKGAELFTPRFPPAPLLGTLFKGSKYDRRPFERLLREYTGEKLMRDVKTVFMATAFNLCSRRTHFIYSYDEYELDYPVWKVIGWSALSAALYFGKIDVPEFVWDDYLPDGKIREDVRGAVFQDGGQGINNCTLSEASIFSIARKWFDEEVVILSIGCGDSMSAVPYGEAKRTGLIGQIAKYIFQARNEATINQYLGARYLSITRSNNYKLVRINCRLEDSRTDVIDGKKYLGLYEEIGEKLTDEVPFDLFV
jgi:patatin-like phospholipase/acyl hydrolase